MSIGVPQLSAIRELLALDASYSKVCAHLSLPQFDVLEKIRPFLPPCWKPDLFLIRGEKRQTLLQAFDRAIRYEKFLQVSKRLDAGASLDNAIFDSFDSAFARDWYRAEFRKRSFPEETHRETAKKLVDLALYHPEIFEDA